MFTRLIIDIYQIRNVDLPNLIAII